MRGPLAALLTLAIAGGADAAGPRYRFTAETTITSTVTSACTAREGGAKTTETFLWELKSTQTGTSAIGRGTREPKGAWKISGTIRRESARETEGFDPQPPQGGTEPMQERTGTSGLLYRFGKRRLELRLSHGGLLDPVFAPLAVGRSTTIVQDAAPEESVSTVSTTDGGSCTDTERTDSVRTIEVTRVR